MRVSTWNRDVCDVAVILGSALDLILAAFEPELALAVSLRDRSLKEEVATSDLTLSSLVDLGFGMFLQCVASYVQAVTGRVKDSSGELSMSYSRFR
jgi:DICT domain-containing protein